eukprot:TRINITY_DN293_c0_g1_i9.p3 TRINITY_DN293_c0_g1~~TRINITY_DN293_c0_g1_i9.p3  ORF type:complete len:154 (-),score=21.20 TRINITY_DN293_c0_g1_i9:675-1136(-)
MAVKPLWQPELQMVLPKAVVSPSPLITTLVPVGHDAAALRRPAESALPPPPVADQTRQQRQEQELVELLSSQGDTEQLPVPPAVDVFPQAPLRVVRPPLWSNPVPHMTRTPSPPWRWVSQPCRRRPLGARPTRTTSTSRPATPRLACWGLPAS